MEYTYPEIVEVAKLLRERVTDPAEERAVLNSPELKALYSRIPMLEADERSVFGSEVNRLRQELAEAFAKIRADQEEAGVTSIDVTAPFDINVAVADRPRLLTADKGSIHPLMRERDQILDIFYRMGFTASESREIDDDYHMFTALNFPEGHPARDHYDTFMTEEGLIAPAHTSTMQNRLLKQYKDQLEAGTPIAVVVPDRVFRNEDVDARHEHTFHQLEGIYVDKGVNVGHLLASLQTFLSSYYGKQVEFKTQPFYFPFTEPSFEFALSCPFCDKAGCNICSYSGWIELLGCGMIHPNVLREAGIDPEVYTGFAWGLGIERLVMMKYDIEDVRHFFSGKLTFLRQFA